MAEIDIDRNPVPGEPFIEVYPISTRLLTTGLWMSWSIGEGKFWPVEDDPDMGDAFGQRQVWCYYADKHPDVGDFEEHVGPGIFYDDEWNAIQLFSELDTAVHAGGEYVYAPAWIHYDLSGIPAGSIQRAEFICNIGGFENQAPDDLPFIVQMRSDITDYQGWRPSPFDFRTITGASVCPPLRSSEIIDNSGADSHRYSDPYLHPDYGDYGPRHVLPINESGVAQLRRGGRQGIIAGMAGETAPTGLNFLYMECDYMDWDTGLQEGQPKILAGAELPHLRLWLGGAEADVTLGLSIEARPRIETPRPVLDHQARRLRGW